MNSRLTTKQLEQVRRLDACTLANTIELFHRRLRNEGFADPSIRCLIPNLSPMLGYAATLTIVGASPPTAGNLYAYRTDWLDYITRLPEPRVVVIEDASDAPGLAALVGSVHMSILHALRCVGVVTNGSVRSIPLAERLAFNLFAGSVGLSHGYVHIIEFGMPVTVGGLKIESGDLLHGDQHGVQRVPEDLVADIPSVAEKIMAREQALIQLCHSFECSIEGLREAVRERLRTDCRNRLF